MNARAQEQHLVGRASRLRGFVKVGGYVLAANEHDTVLTVRIDARGVAETIAAGTTLRAYVLRGSATAQLEEIAARLRRGRLRWIVGMLAFAVVGAAVGLGFWLQDPAQQSLPFLLAGPFFVAMIVIALAPRSSVSVPGMMITDIDHQIVVDRLTPADRDALLESLDDAWDVQRTALQMLSEKYQRQAADDKLAHTQDLRRRAQRYLR